MIVSEFTTIKHLRAKYHNQHGIIATLTGMFQGSINIQQIAAKLLAPFKEHWNPRKKYFRSSMNIIALLNFLHINLKKKSTLLYFFQYSNDSCIICFRSAGFFEDSESRGIP